MKVLPREGTSFPLPAGRWHRTFSHHTTYESIVLSLLSPR